MNILAHGGDALVLVTVEAEERDTGAQRALKRVRA